MSYLKENAVIVAMMLVGVVWPDIDHAIPFLPHRSGLTHSVLVPVALLGTRALPPSAVAGMLMGIAVSLTADLFPKAWIGFATIHLPLWGSLGWLSPVWLVVNVLGAVMLAHFNLTAGGRRRWPWLAYGVLWAVAGTYALVLERSVLTLLAFTGLWGLGVHLTSRAFRPSSEPR